MNKITTREKAILHMIAFEHSNREIAELMYISCDTVKTHRKNLFQKLNAKNAAGLIRRAFELGLLTL